MSWKSPHLQEQEERDLVSRGRKPPLFLRDEIIRLCAAGLVWFSTIAIIVWCILKTGGPH